MASAPLREIMNVRYPMLTRVLFSAVALLTFAWPRYLFFKLGQSPGFNPYTLSTVLAMVAALGYAALSASVRARMALVLRNHALAVVMLALFLTGSALTTLINPPANVGDAQWRTVLLGLVYRDSLFITGLVMFLDRRLRRVWTFGGLLVMIGVGLLALVELVTHERTILMLGLDRFAAQDTNSLENLTTSDFRNASFRVKSLMTHSIVYGTVCGAMLPVCLHYARVRSLQVRMVAVLCAVLCAIGTVISTSRAGIVAAIVSLAIYGFTLLMVRLRNPAMVFLSVVLVTTATVGVGSVAADGVALLTGRNNDERHSSIARDYMLSYGLAAINRRPVLGYGVGSGKYLAGLTQRSRSQWSVDNYILTVFVEGGVVSGISLVAFLVLAVIGAFSGIIRQRDPTEASLNSAVLAMLVAVAVTLWVATLDDIMQFSYLLVTYLFCAIAAEADPLPIAGTGIPAAPYRRSGAA